MRVWNGSRATARGMAAFGAACGAALAAALMAAPAAAKEGQLSFSAQSSAVETGSGDDAEQRIVNATYAFDQIFAPGTGDLVSVLFAQRITAVQSPGAEAPASTLEVTAYRRGAKGYDTAMWTLADDADEGVRIGDYYRTTLYGCCGAENTYRNYSAWTGKLAFAASSDPVFVSIPNTGVTRAIGYLSANSAGDFDLERWPGGAGLVTLADGDHAVDRVLLEADEASDFLWNPTVTLEGTGVDGSVEEMNGDTLDLWAANGDPDPRGLSGFSLVLSWDDQQGEVARIPITAGRFDLERAVLPEGLTVRRLGD